MSDWLISENVWLIGDWLIRERRCSCSAPQRDLETELMLWLIRKLEMSCVISERGVAHAQHLTGDEYFNYCCNMIDSQHFKEASRALYNL